MKTLNRKSVKSQSGFTLIEIAIVLVIIGLLLGGVLQGQQLIENSRVKAAVNDFKGIAAAAFSYQDRYGRLPGDDPGAATSRGNNWTSVTAGSGNGSIGEDATSTVVPLVDTFKPGATSEAAYFFQHLRAAGFISGDAAQTGTNALPQNPFGGLVGITNAPMGGNLAGTKICMGNINGSSAIALDSQLDDGIPGTGNFRAIVGENNTAPTNTALSSTYSEDSVYTVCLRI